MSDQDIANAGNYDDLAWLNHRVSELEAPYRLVDTPPTEPGWYVAKWQGRFMFCEVTQGNHGLKFNGQYAEPDSSLMWGSAPLPIKGYKT